MFGFVVFVFSVLWVIVDFVYLWFWLYVLSGVVVFTYIVVWVVVFCLLRLLICYFVVGLCMCDLVVVLEWCVVC